MISTVVSLARRAVYEEIPGMQHSTYTIPACDDNRPRILHVSDSFYYKPDLDGNQDRVMVSSEQLANSVVDMHISSQLLYRVDQHPALFAISNREVDAEGALTEFKAECREALKKQKQWFVALVRLADDDWQTAKKHRMISDIQRTAAIELGLKRDWLNAVMDEDQENCPFCGTGLLNPMAPICPTCGKVHNPEKLAALEAKMGIVPTVNNPVSGRRI
jgi:hypothetical protein